MDLINNFLNLVAPPFTFFTLLFFWPPFLALKSFLSVLNSFFPEDVAGKVVLITGASSGIGEHLAYEYARREACLVLAARRENRLGEVAGHARELGSPDVLMIRADVSRPADCKRIVDETISHYGRLDHLINNAGIHSACLLEDSGKITEFKEVMDINFWGSVYTTYFGVQHLRNSKGKIVVLSSSAAWLPAPRSSIYNASKAALASIFETLRVEFGPDIKITLATPGFVESEITQGKFLLTEGKMEVRQDLRDTQIGVLPIATAEGCAKAIVNAVCRGDRYVTQPAWFRVTYYWKVFFPEVLEWMYRLYYLPSSSAPQEEALSKRILEMTGAKNFLYPSSVQSTEVKAD